MTPVDINDYVDEYHERFEKSLTELGELAKSSSNREIKATVALVSTALLQLENIVDLLEAEATYQRMPFWKKIYLRLRRG